MKTGVSTFLQELRTAGRVPITVLTMIVAEELGLKYEDVQLQRVDTAYTPVDPGSYGTG